jgi:hypothetical protein
MAFSEMHLEISLANGFRRLSMYAYPYQSATTTPLLSSPTSALFATQVSWMSEAAMVPLTL